MNDVIIRYQNMPYTVHGVVSEDENGDYNVYINALLSYEEQQKAIKHELAHIERGDFDNDASIDQVERAAARK